MAELMTRDGTWAFDGEAVRIVPGSERGVHRLRQELGEQTVPLAAVASISYEPGRKGGRLRLRLRDGADPLLQATGGHLPDEASPYHLSVEADRAGVAEYFVDEVRRSLLLEEIPEGPCDHYLLPGPAVPVSGAGVDGTATFDGERVAVSWRWNTTEHKKHAGPQEFAVGDLAAVEWQPPAGLESGFLRFRPHGVKLPSAPEHDPHAIELWGFKKESGTVLLAAAVTARLPHPKAPARRPAPTELAGRPTGPAPAAPADDHDTLLRRLRELGDLRRDGILSEDEFTAAKAAVLERFNGAG
ncbi:DUF4429 domain-containing protein [Streptomyces sp. NPDC014733]|uniref:DUF4429 domain-containing protein n=1 Tax=Streptomyces sp. NPDC014733 TaxID=3364885 RepID=UPI0036F87D8F